MVQVLVLIGEKSSNLGVLHIQRMLESVENEHHTVLRIFNELSLSSLQVKGTGLNLRILEQVIWLL